MYRIINEETIQKRIEELKESQKGLSPYLDTIDYYGIENEINTLKNILSNSIPLIPEIEKAFSEGIISDFHGEVQDYISQLKLDI